MNKTIELVNSWGKFEETRPNGSIDDFCHFYITQNRIKEKRKDALGGIVPPDSYSSIAKMIGRLAKLHNTYAMSSLMECGLTSFDEFLYLNSIFKSQSPKKTKVIYENFNELSSGLLILERLKKKDLIIEEKDSVDKRSKRLSLSKRGKTLLEKCYKNMGQLNGWFFKSISKEDIDLCIHLFSDTEVRFSKRWLEDKEKPFEILSKTIQ
jgi:hypothetical protein